MILIQHNISIKNKAIYKIQIVCTLFVQLVLVQRLTKCYTCIKQVKLFKKVGVNLDKLLSTLKIAICDDLESERNVILTYLSEYLDKNGMVAEIDEFTNGESFLNSDVSSYNLVFMDIFMDGINGMETAKKLIENEHRTQIVFCSTSTEFAAESYDVSALHYLVKPLEKEKFFKVLERFFSTYINLKTITVKVGRIEEDIFIQDILYVESDNHKCIIHTKNGDIIASIPISKLAEMLMPYDFIKPVRYAIVALREIVNIPTDTVVLPNGITFSVGRKERENVRKAFTEYKWKTMQRKMGDM